MPIETSNELGRAIHYLSRAIALTGGGPWKDPSSVYMVELWAEVFGIARVTTNAADEQGLHDAVATELVALRETLVRSKARMVRSRIPDDIYNAAFQRALRATSPFLLATHAKELASLLTIDVVNYLRICAADIGVEENELEPDALERLVTLLNELEEAVAAEPGLHPEVKSFFYDVIGRLRRALREYPVRGIVAIREGLFQVYGQWHAQKETLVQSTPKEQQSLLKRFQEIMTFVVALEKTGEIVHKLAPGALQLLEGIHFHKLLGP